MSALDGRVSELIGLLEEKGPDGAYAALGEYSDELGAALLERGKDGVEATRLALAELFSRSGDMVRVSAVATTFGDPLDAAEALALANHASAAAYLFMQAGQLERAAEIFERAGLHEAALQLHTSSGNQEAAATVLERLGRWLDAGIAWMRLQKLDEAERALAHVEFADREFVPASVLLGRIWEHKGQRQAAADRYLEVVRSRPVAPATVEIFERLALFYLEGGGHASAKKLLAAVLSVEPERETALRAMAQIRDAQARGAGEAAAPRTGHEHSAAGALSHHGTVPDVPLARGSAPSQMPTSMRGQSKRPAAAHPGHAPAALATPVPPAASSGPGVSAARPVPAPSPSAGSSVQAAVPAAAASRPRAADAPAPLMLPRAKGSNPGAGRSLPAEAPRTAPRSVPVEPSRVAHASTPHFEAVSVPASPVPLIDLGHGPHETPAGGPVLTEAQFETLSSVAMFSELTAEERMMVFGLGELSDYAEGEMMIEQDRPPRRLLIVLSGSAEVSRLGPPLKVVAELGPGAPMGELGLVDEGPAPAQIRAKTNSVVFRWSLDKFRRFLAAHESIALRIYRSMIRTLSARLRKQRGKNA